jgi:hypothetical protein
VSNGEVVLDLPFQGRWLARNSPARRVPSHGTHLFGLTYAIDFIAVDQRGRPAAHSWRRWLAVERPDAFVGFGMPILAPASGTVVTTHDGEPDHVARRSQLTLIPYALGQARRVRRGLPAVAGNCVAIALGPNGPYVWLAHLRQGTVRVQPGDEVAVGEPVAECGNSGNSTQPHIHIQVTDTSRWQTAHGLPMVFRSYRRASDGRVITADIPSESEIVEIV